MLKFLLPSFYRFTFFHLFGVMHREICVKDFSGTAAPRILKFGTKIGYDYLYCVGEIQHSHANHSLYLSILLFLNYFFFLSQHYENKLIQIY